MTDEEAYREQLAYLLERSPFYRDKLAGLLAGGLDRIAELPLTEKAELRATGTPENPFGAHLCAAPEEIARIYSTSGTTGTPSLVCNSSGWTLMPRRSAMSIMFSAITIGTCISISCETR